MRFSLRMMTSGVLSWSKVLSRLFRLMTRRYKSFKSEVANRPPSSGTSGRKSGGITQHRKNHPFRTALGNLQALEQFDPLRQFFADLLALGFGHQIGRASCRERG